MAAPSRRAAAGRVAAAVAFALTVVVWVVGLTRAALARGPFPGGVGVALVTDGGTVGVAWVAPRPAAWRRWDTEVDEVGTAFGTRRGLTYRWAGFGYERVTLFGSTETGVCAPAWFPTVLAGLAAVAVRRAGRGAARRRAGACAGCGYDLRATPDQCPECGAVPAHDARPRRV